MGMNIGGARAGLSDATFIAALEELQDVILAFQASVDDGVPLNPSDISQLQQVTATVMGMPSDYPDAAANTKLNDIKTLLTTVNTNLGTLHTDLDENTAEIADNGTLLEQIRDIVDLLPTTAPQTNALTDTQLRATPVPVSGPLTDAQLRASSILTDLYLSSVQSFGPLSSSTATVLLTTEAKGRFYSIQYTSGTGANIIIEGSNDNATWVRLGASPADAASTNATGVTSNGIQRVQSTIWTGEIPTRYIRFSTTSTTATTVYIIISPTSLTSYRTRYATGDGWTDSVQVQEMMAWLRGFNGSSWDRIRAGTRTHGSTNLTGALHVTLNSGAYSVNQSAVGASSSQSLGQSVPQHGLQVTQQSGTVSAIKVELLGSLGNSTWFTIATWELGGSGTQALGDIVFVTGKPVLFIRFNVVSISGGGTAGLLWAGAV